MIFFAGALRRLQASQSQLLYPSERGEQLNEDI
jgi:hypothetical protein